MIFKIVLHCSYLQLQYFSSDLLDIQKVKDFSDFLEYLKHSKFLENKVIKEIISELYYPKSSYEFSVIPVEILGSAYEQFLGKIIRITQAHNVKVEEKPEVRKSSGVYYTPQYIVDYIVENTVGKLIEGNPKEISKLRILDRS